MEEKQIESYNSHLAHSVKNFFPPSWLEIIIYFLSSAVLLGVLNYHVFTNSIGNNSGLSQTNLDSYLHNKLGDSADFISRLLEGRISSILFWAFLGSIIYMAIWVIQNVIINVENDVQASGFVGMQNQAVRRKAYWHSVVSSKIFFLCALVVSIIYTVLLAEFLLPVSSRAFGLAFSSGHFTKSLLSIVLSVVGTAVFLYILMQALRIVARSWRWIIGNF